MPCRCSHRQYWIVRVVHVYKGIRNTSSLLVVCILPNNLNRLFIFFIIWKNSLFYDWKHDFSAIFSCKFIILLPNEKCTKKTSIKLLFFKKICHIKLEFLVLQKLAAKEEGQQRKARSKMTSYMYIWDCRQKKCISF